MPSRIHLISRKIKSLFFGNICDNCYREKKIAFSCAENGTCQVVAPLPQFKEGWRAAFVEAHYNLDQIHFVITSEIDISPDIMPPLAIASDLLRQLLF